MSNAVFPVLAGLDWNVIKTPVWKTRIQEAVSGKELRAALMSYPLWKFSLSYTVLRANAANAELQTLMGFFNARQGMFDSFLYTDPTDNSVANQSFGTGDGSTTAFQLLRSLGGFTEPIQNVNGTPTIYINGTPTAAFTLGSTGVVTFTTAPAPAAALTWSGNFYYRCRFLQDSSEFDNFMRDLWALKKLTFQSVKL